jgi:hypothetical protein
MMSRPQAAGHYHNTEVANKPFQNEAYFKDFLTMVKIAFLS